MVQKNYLQISETDLKKIHNRKSRDEAIKVDPEWLVIARMGKHYGWGAIEAILGKDMTENPSSDLVAMLVRAGDIVDNHEYFMMHQASYVGSRIAKVQKNAGKKFRDATRDLAKASRADING